MQEYHFETETGNDNISKDVEHSVGKKISGIISQIGWAMRTERKIPLRGGFESYDTKQKNYEDLGCAGEALSIFMRMEQAN
jgi:hypothetical protein